MALRPGLLIYTGRIGSAHRHHHAATQVVLTVDGEVELIDDSGARWRGRTAVIPAGIPHEITGTATGLLAFADAESGLGQTLADRVRATGAPAGSVLAWSDAAEPLHAIEPADVAGIPDIADHALRLLAGELSAPAKARHPALWRALALLPKLLDRPLRLPELAAAAGVSCSRLGHLFRAEIGLPFPPYLRWARLQRAFELARDGATLTDTAHAAGFADSAHLTRVCREMFGLTPTELARATGLPAVRVNR
ncbi:MULTISPECIES: helix-turn-helix transcriptional regulator [Nocardia]|uniref:helix-turn-helix transcriptional regulator n=1 Tax=Nocardia TaxID=1817 RepID=UPI002456D745|nr:MULTISPECIES: helix-turn-helix domain-containing protein [Nocardia]